MGRTLLMTTGLGLALAGAVGPAQAEYVAMGDLEFNFDVSWDDISSGVPGDETFLSDASSGDVFSVDFPLSPVDLLNQTQFQIDLRGGSSSGSDDLSINGQSPNDPNFFLGVEPPPPVKVKYNSSVEARSPVPGSAPFSQGAVQLVEETTFFLQSFDDRSEQKIVVSYDFDVDYDLTSDASGLGSAFVDVGAAYQLFLEGVLVEEDVIFEDSTGTSSGPSFTDSFAGSGALILSGLQYSDLELRITTVSSATAVSQVPVPAALPLFLTGLAAAGWAARRRARAAVPA